MTRTVKVAAVLAALMAVLAGCRTMTGRSAGTLMNNATTTASVKAKLSADNLANLTWVDVDVNDGVVYLTGNAATAEQKQRATEIAKSTSGVRKVVNNIVVNSETRTASSGSAAPSASVAATGPTTAEVVAVDHQSGNLSLRMTDGDEIQLRLPPASVADVKAGDRVAVSVSPLGR